MKGIHSIEDVRLRCYVDEATGCWHWRLAIRGDRRPAVNVWIDGKKVQLTGRKAVLILSGRDGAPGQCAGPAMHCRSRDCMNPSHARYYTRQQLIQLYADRGSYASAAMHAAVKQNGRKGSRITAEQAAQIRLRREPARVIAAEYGISISAVSAIRTGKSWAQGAANSSVFNWRPAA